MTPTKILPQCPTMYLDCSYSKRVLALKCTFGRLQQDHYKKGLSRLAFELPKWSTSEHAKYELIFSKDVFDQNVVPSHEL